MDCYTWNRTTNRHDGIEKWTCGNTAYDVKIRLGKPIDICALKLPVLESFDEQVKTHRETRQRLYSSDGEDVTRCPVCGHKATDRNNSLSVYGAIYRKCERCNHHYVGNRPTRQSLEAFYKNDTSYASTYTDRRTLMVRVSQVATPKLEWVVNEYRRLYGREPSRILDVGAGGGHFVYACQQKGYDAVGIEPSEDSRRFCRDNFGLRLDDTDFIGRWRDYDDFDVITFWGLIEHVPSPCAMLRAAHKALKGRNTLAVADVPRWDCLSTAVQRYFNDSIVRHLDPQGHIHCFTDDSLATAFRLSGFAPCSAWYFGMDAYEFMVQAAYAVNEPGILEVLKLSLPVLQGAIDSAKLSDEMVLAGTPV